MLSPLIRQVPCYSLGLSERICTILNFNNIVAGRHGLAGGNDPGYESEE